MISLRRLPFIPTPSTLGNIRGAHIASRLASSADCCSPEAVLVLRSISVFETLYLSRSTSRMSEIANSATASYLSGRGNPPGASEGVTIARTVTNELDSARFDPLLVRTVARNAVKVLDSLMSKIEGLVSYLGKCAAS